MASSDYELLRAWREGDDHSGNVLVRRHFATLSRFFGNKAPDAVADLIQRTYLGCVESRDRVPEGLPFKVYALGIARRVLAQHYRERQRHGLPREGASRVHDPAASPSLVVAAKHEQELLLEALRRLPLDLQMVLELFYWEHLKTEEIGQVLEIPAGTVKSRIHRAKKVLREKIAEVASSGGLAESTLANLEDWARSLRRYMERTSAEPR